MADAVRGNVFDITTIADRMLSYTLNNLTTTPQFTSEQVDTLTHLKSWQQNAGGSMNGSEPGVVFAYWMRAAKLQGTHPIVANENPPPYGQGSAAMSLFLDALANKSTFSNNEIETIQELSTTQEAVLNSENSEVTTSPQGHRHHGSANT